MKKFAVILVIAFVTVLALSSCSKNTCPAYSQADTEQAGHVG
jgi:outer membrane protein assembly factor BamE (lipoprotein component of BamABCDE complex)